MKRRDLLFSAGKVAAVAAVAPVHAAELRGFPADTAMHADHLPSPIRFGGFQTLTNQTDRQTLQAVFDRLIPADESGPSASQAGVLEFLDAQLSGTYGEGKALYLSKPLSPDNEAELMGSPQFIATPKERYQTGIRALQAYAKQADGKAFHELDDARIDQILAAMEAGTLQLGGGVNAQALFELMLQNAREGYLADPIYGGNRDMAGWKMIGFPGARYDYRPYVDRPNEDLALIPVSLIPAD